jgi:hypothetical protein
VYGAPRTTLPRLRERVDAVPMEPGSLVNEWNVLRGIKQRAERLASAGKRHSLQLRELGGKIRRRHSV